VPLTAEMVLHAYRLGAFPMARHRQDRRVVWVEPELRGILPLQGFHLPRSLKKTLKKGLFSIRYDSAFAQVIESCAEKQPDRPDSWINEEIIRVFNELHCLGLAHSVEAWQDDCLVGGLYGLSLGSAFFGESMFSRVTDASKVALAHLVARLRLGGYTLLDTQFLTGHLANFGAVQIPRLDYLALLDLALKKPARFYGNFPDGDVLALLSSSQSTTQIS